MAAASGLVTVLCLLCLIGNAWCSYRVTVIEQEPFVFRDEDGMLNGFLIDLVNALRSKINFLYTLDLVPDGKFGSKQPDGSWNGLVGEVMRRKAIFALAPLTITHAREQVLDFTMPYLETGLSVLIKRPKSGEELPFNTLTELMSADDYRYGPIGSGTTYQTLTNSSNQMYKEMGEFIKQYEHELPSSYLEGVTKVRKGERPFAFIGESVMLEYFAGQRPCNLMKMPSDFSSKSYGLAFARGDRLVHEFSNAILQLREEGKIDELRKKWWSGECRQPKLCMCKHVSSEESEEGKKGGDESEGEPKHEEDEEENEMSKGDSNGEEEDDDDSGGNILIIDRHSLFLAVAIIYLWKLVGL